jgi:hypothetical protein
MRLSSASSEYMRASCAYALSIGLTAKSAAHMRPARSPKRLQPAQSATGTDSSAGSSDSTWTLTTPSPNSAIHTCRAM